MFKPKKTYADGLLEGQAFARQEFERILAVLREELTDMRRERNQQAGRADAACDLLLQHLGTRAISLAGKREETERTERQLRVVSTLASIPDPTEELPFGDPRGEYADPSGASLFATGEDVAQ